MLYPLLAIVPMSLLAYELFRYHKETEHIKALSARLVALSQQIGLKNYSIRKLKYNRIFSNSHMLLRDIDKGLTAIEWKFKQPKPRRVRSLILTSNDDILSEMEERMDRLEELAQQRENEE